MKSLKKVKEFGITAKEAEVRTKELSTAADYSAKESNEMKAEPQDESEIICYYYTGEESHHCPGPMGDERHYVIKNGKMVMAHKRCHAKSQDTRSNLHIIIKGGSSC